MCWMGSFGGFAGMWSVLSCRWAGWSTSEKLQSDCCPIRLYSLCIRLEVAVSDCLARHPSLRTPASRRSLSASNDFEPSSVAVVLSTAAR